MKIQIPQHEVEACDCCERTNVYLVQCKACGRDHCLNCRANIPGCIHQVDVCNRCGDTHEVRAAVQRFVPSLREVLAERDDAIVRAAQRFEWKVSDASAAEEVPN